MVEQIALFSIYIIGFFSYRNRDTRKQGGPFQEVDASFQLTRDRTPKDIKLRKLFAKRADFD